MTRWLYAVFKRHLSFLVKPQQSPLLGWRVSSSIRRLLLGDAQRSHPTVEHDRHAIEVSNYYRTAVFRGVLGCF